MSGNIFGKIWHGIEKGGEVAAVGAIAAIEILGRAGAFQCGAGLRGRHAPFDHSEMKLGRQAVRRDHRTLRLAHYFTAALPAAPPSADWTGGLTEFGMMLNDKLGDCTIAGVGHAVQTLSACAGNALAVTDDQVEAAYEAWDNYNPADPSTDQGGVEIDVLNDWRKQGFAGAKLLAYADPDCANVAEICQAIDLFGGVYVGLSLPLTAQTQAVWDLVSTEGDGAAGSWGGHCVWVPKYLTNPDGTIAFVCITWGELKVMTQAFWDAYCDEAHSPLVDVWLGAKGAPSGFNQAQLEADLAAIV